MKLPFFPHRQVKEPRPPSEQEVIRAGDDFARKQKLVDKLHFLPQEYSHAAKDAALHRFLEILFSHLRL